jgi:tetratricopeptide (TPR) repeat protein
MIVVEECPKCGAPAPTAARRCAYCKAEFAIKTLSSLGSLDRSAINRYIAAYKRQLQTQPQDAEAALALGLCYLDLGLYDKAIELVNTAIAQMPEQADVYYYAAVALFKGRKPRTLTLNEIKHIESLLEAACQLDDDKAHYYYLRAVIKREYYSKNGLRVVGASDAELLTLARSRHVDGMELAKLLERIPMDETPIKAAIRAVIQQ